MNSYYNVPPDPELVKASTFTADFIETCVGCTPEELLEYFLRGDEEPSFVYVTKGQATWCRWIPGGFIGEENEQKMRAPTLLLGAAPTESEVYGSAMATVRTGLAHLFADTVSEEEYHSWYFTYMVKYAMRDRDGKDLMKSAVQSCLPVFQQELRRTDPAWVLVLGTKAAKAFMGLKKLTIEQCLRQVFQTEYKFADGKTAGFNVLVLPSLIELFSGKQQPYFLEILKKQLAFFKEQTSVSEDFRREYVPVEDTMPEGHKIVYFPEELKAEVDRIMGLAKEDPRRKVIAVDMEWEGEYPGQPGAHLLTAQFSSAPGEATVVVLDGEKTREFDNKANSLRLKGLVKELNRLLTWHDDWRPRVGGHFLRADLPWLLDLGITGTVPGQDIRWSFMPAKDPESCRWAGGWDTSLMYHAVNEKDSYGLKYLADKLLDTPKWEVELINFRERWEAENKQKVKGFGCIPDSILHPYAAWDADATRRLAELMMFGYNGHPPMLDSDIFGNDCWRPYCLAHRASLGFLEIEMNGLIMDRQRFAALSRQYGRAYEVLLEDFREKVNWPDFNPASSKHKHAVLFGETFGLTWDKNQQVKKTLPEGARSLNLLPIYESRNKILWNELSADQDEYYRPEEHGYDPATDKNAMSLLAQVSPEARQLRDLCKLRHLLSGVLSPEEEFWDDKGYHRLYPKGHYKHLRNDGCVHSSMRQLLATGRSSSSNPNLQNIGKSSEEYLKDMLGYVKDGAAKGTYLDVFGEPLYLYPIRTIYGSLKDWMIIEVDWKGAELAVMSWVSQDERMLDDVRRNALDEDDPDFYDIHSNMAVEAFHLDCEPTKSGLASIGKKHLRVAAKAVAFGIPYGRGYRAIAFQCRAEGVDITDSEAQNVVEHYFTKYPGTRKFLDSCKEAVCGCGYVKTLFGRYRRFLVSETTPEDVIAKMQREFCNAPIQGTVADAMNVSIYNLLRTRYLRPELRFKIIMQVHDSLVLMVHKDDAAEMYRRVIPDAMVNDNPIYCGGKEYHFSIDMDLYRRWGEPLTDEIALSDLGMTVAQLKGEA